MAYSSKKNLLFIHIPKNAGKSVESAFGFVPDALIHKPSIRSRFNRFAKLLLKLSSSRLPKEVMYGPIDYTLCGQHLCFAEIEMLNLICNADLSRATTFAVVRNPYSRAVSTYKHFSNDASLEGFKRFWRKIDDFAQDHNKLAHVRTQICFLRNSRGEVAVQNLLRFERLEEDLNQFCQEHGFSFNRLPHLGASHSERALDYLQFYDCEAKLLIEDYFAEDFEQLGYRMIDET